MGERSYLAIGDVLALLREEFPDITISKIRFLESRGLLVPERTPSGYRKFYEPDVERLRWILRQQREHFLPLKVIKGRLEKGMSDPDAPTPHLFEVGDPPPEREPQVSVIDAQRKVEDPRLESFSSLEPVAAVASGGERMASRGGTPASTRHDGDTAASRATGAAATRPSHGGRTTGPDPAPAVREEGAEEISESPRSRRPRSRASEPAPEATDEQGEQGREDSIETARHAAARSTAGLPGAGLSGVSFTLTELANASGLDVPGVEELERYGLIAGRTLAGVHCYDEEAVLVAKLAARFAPYGIEARHLRLFKHAADRQTGLFSQVVTPLLRQRNPEAHARAIEDLSDLSELAEALVRCFSQAMQREMTGG
jgi:DNA-binding transcriptional MerR regulator